MEIKKTAKLNSEDLLLAIGEYLAKRGYRHGCMDLMIQTPEGLWKTDSNQIRDSGIIIVVETEVESIVQ